MKIIADLHTHTIASTHAFSTLDEMVRAASDAGLNAIAITDHGRAMAGAPGQYYFESLPMVPDYLYSVRVLKGIEANIINYDGTLDCDKSILHKLDWVVASIHSITLLEKPTVEKCTNAYLSVARNPYVNVIAHSGSPYYAYNYEEVIKECAATGTLIEINNASFSSRKDSIPNCTEIARICKRLGARIVVDSDSHFHTYVGKFDNALAMLKEIEFPPELVVNSSVDNLKQYMREKNIQI